jgi:diaminopimelate epimerase
MSAAPNHTVQTKIKFVKMSGAGNDFAIFDARQFSEFSLSAAQIQKIANRKNIGCDQLIVIKKPLLQKKEKALNVDLTDADQIQNPDCLMEIYNPDGSKSEACGNATRCVAAILFSETNKSEINIKTAARVLKCWRAIKNLAGENLISVNMGIPSFDWQKIPLLQKTNTQKISLFNFDFACVNVGNPHAVAFINAPLSDKKFFEIGSKVETNKIFPQKTNVEFAQILSDNLIEVRVWERGAGETLACGSGACAVAILAIKNGLMPFPILNQALNLEANLRKPFEIGARKTSLKKNSIASFEIENGASAAKKITTRFKGGDLTIEWNGDNSPVIMTGGYEKIFTGELDESFFK